MSRYEQKTKTLLAFLISVLIAIPLFAIIYFTAQPEIIEFAEISAIGWFAGAAIVGTWIYYRK